MPDKLKILQLSPRFPFPADDGGKIGIANILKQFAVQGAEVTFFSLYEEEIPSEVLNHIKEFAEPVLIKHSIQNTPARLFKSFFTREPLFIFKHRSNEIYSTLKKLLQEKKFDVIHTDHSSMAPLGLYAKSLINKPLGLRLHNIEWLIWQRYADVLPVNSLKRKMVHRQANLLRKAEVDYYSRADVCFAITEPDKERATAMSPTANVVVAGAGINPEEWMPDRTIRRNPNELILATTYHWVHNVDALKWFIEKVLPIVKEKIPEIRLTLLGKEAPEWLGNYSRLGVELVGYVPEVQPFFNKANINIAPLFVGAGVRIKILEAMAMELPVVASPVAAEGISAGEKDGLFICRDEYQFANTIIRLCLDFEKARKAGESARKYAVENFSWKRNVGIMLEEYRKLVNGRL